MAVSLVVVYEKVALREGLRLLLQDAGFDVKGATGDFETAIDLVNADEPDVVLIDLGLREKPASELVKAVFELACGTRVLLYCGAGNSLELHDCLELGAKGYVSKSSGTKDLVRAVDTVAKGRKFADKRYNAGDLNGSISATRLSTREREVLALLAGGLSGADIAKEFWLSPETVRTHIRNAMSKLGAKTRVHAITLAVMSGQIHLKGSSARAQERPPK